MSDLTYVYSKSAIWTQDSVRIADLRSLTPPAIVSTIGNLKTTWFDMAIPVDTGLEPMQAEFKTGADTALLALFGFIPGNSTRVQARRTYVDSAGGLHTFVDELEGVIGSITPDEHGSDSKEGVGLTVVLNLSYYKLTVDGQEIYEIDPQNMVRAVNGQNTLAAEKDALLM